MRLEPVIFDFLETLEQNNNREWFNQNKGLYERALKNVRDFVTGLIEGISLFDSSVGNQDAKNCIFRIYRDVRFSSDKRPYKIHFGAYIAPHGRQSDNAGYYLHLQNNGSLMSGGLWRPESAALKKIREEIYYAPEDLLEIVNNRDFKSTFGKLIDGDNLKRPPRNYPTDFEHIHLLQYRHFCVEKALSNTEVLSANFLQTCLETSRHMFPLIAYMNRLINIKDEQWTI